MPEIGRIQSTTFQSLLTDLGITRNNIPFGLQSEVMPVVLVGGTVSFLASPTPAYQVTDVFSAGLQVAPAALFVLADTGPLPIGAYSVHLIVTASEANSIQFQWRDAANAVNLVIHRFRITTNTNFQVNVRLDIQNDNERFRVLNTVAGVAGQEYQATIFAKT